MQIPLIDVFDIKGRPIPTTLNVPDAAGSSAATITFAVPFGAGGAFHLATVLQAAATYADDSAFIMHDGYEGDQNTYIPTPWIRRLAKSAMDALPRTVGDLVLSVTFVPADPLCPF